MKNIAVQLITGFEEIEAITIIDVLRRAGLNVIVVSMINELKVTGSHDITIIADAFFNDVDYSEIDMIVLPGGMPGSKYLDKHDGLRKQIIDFNSKNKMLGAICAAPMVLGHLNVLDGKKAVCYPGIEKELNGAEIDHEPAIISENIITGRGVGAALHFSLKIVETLIDKKSAENLAKAMLVA